MNVCHSRQVSVVSPISSVQQFLFLNNLAVSILTSVKLQEGREGGSVRGREGAGEGGRLVILSRRTGNSEFKLTEHLCF